MRIKFQTLALSIVMALLPLSLLVADECLIQRPLSDYLNMPRTPWGYTPAKNLKERIGMKNSEKIRFVIIRLCKKTIGVETSTGFSGANEIFSIDSEQLVSAERLSDMKRPCSEKGKWVRTIYGTVENIDGCRQVQFLRKAWPDQKVVTFIEKKDFTGLDKYLATLGPRVGE